MNDYFLLLGKSEIHQIQLIIDLLGSPNEKIWPSYVDLPGAKNFTFKHQPYNNLKQLFPWLSPSGILLMNNMFMFDPDKRISAEECLNSSYFRENPLPVDKELMPTFPEHRNFKDAWKDSPERQKSKTVEMAGGKRKNTKITDKLIEHLKGKKKKVF